MAGVGAVQGFALYALRARWPTSGTPEVSLFVGAVWAIVASGLVVHMARTSENRRRLILMATLSGVAFGAVAAWVAWKLPPADVDYTGDDARMWTWALASTTALFVLGPFLQIHQATGRFAFPYSDLYRFSWRNFFVVALGGGVGAAFWVVLLLWAALFNLVGIGFFEALFEENAFIYPVTGAVFAYGLVVARGRSAILDALVGITQALFRALLPLVAGISLAFLGSLPVTGLAPLFETNSAAAVLTTWLLVSVLFFNAVYLDGSSATPYGRLVRILCEAGAVAMPALGAIALYALFLRIRQHGLTPDRCWAAVGASVLTLYGAGYAAAALRRGAPWLPLVRKVNVAMSLLVVALAFGLHTPLGDPLGWSLRDQLARLADGRVSWEQFDFKLLRFSLGRAGFEALERLRADPAAHARIDETLAVAGIEVPAAEAKFALVPIGREWPPGLLGTLQRNPRWSQGCSPTCLVFALDIDGDGVAEEFVASNNQIFAFERDSSAGWRFFGHAWEGSLHSLRPAIREGRISTIAPLRRDLLIDGQRVEINSD